MGMSGNSDNRSWAQAGAGAGRRRLLLNRRRTGQQLPRDAWHWSESEKSGSLGPPTLTKTGPKLSPAFLANQIPSSPPFVPFGRRPQSDQHRVVRAPLTYKFLTPLPFCDNGIPATTFVCSNSVVPLSASNPPHYLPRRSYLRL